MWGFPRSKTKPAPVVRPDETLGGVADLLQGWLVRMQELVHARGLASPSDLAAIDEKIDQLCEEAAKEVEKPAQSQLGTRVQRMKRLTLEEMRDLRAKARRGNR